MSHAEFDSNLHCYVVPTTRFRLFTKNRYEQPRLQQWWEFVNGNQTDGEWRYVPVVIEEQP